jgi:iron(III) transport system substrate-binding protein
VRPSRRPGLLAIAGALGLFAAACGSSSKGTGSATTASATTAAAASATTASGATTPAAATSTAAAPTTTGAPGGAAWQEVITKAKAEGKVTIYSSQGVDQLNDLGARFKKEYGIDVEVVRAIDSELQPKVAAEHDTGKGIGDIIAQASAPWSVEKEGAAWFVPATGPAFDAKEYDKATNVSKAGGYFVSTAAILTFGWNTQLYPKGLKDYPDLLDPALAGGKIGVIKPAAASIVDFYMYLTEKYGADFVSKLAAQKPRIYPSSLPMAQALTSGEIAAGSFVGVLTDEKAKGAPVDFGLSNTVWGARFLTSVLKSAPHPNAAQLLANYIVTTPGQEALARKSASVLPNVTGAITTVDKVRLQDLTKLTADIVTKFQADWDKMFT